MFKYIYSIILVFWDVFCCKIFMESFAVSNQRNRKIILRYLLLFGLVVADYFIAFLLAESFFWKQICIIIITSLVWWKYFQFSLKKSIIFFISFQSSALLADYLTITILSRMLPAISSDLITAPATGILISAIGKVLLFCFVIIIKKNFGTKDSDVLTNEEWIRFFIFPLFTVMIIIAIITNWDITSTSQQINVLLCIALGLSVMNVVIFYLLRDILKREMQIRQDKLFKERIRSETDLYRSISVNYDKQRKRAHEYKNHMECIVELAKNSNYEELNKYLKIVNDEIDTYTDIIDTNNIIVNAILNSKYREGKKKGIIFILQVSDLSDIKISDEDIVIILSNLLNNSIEACEKCSEKIVKLKFVKERNHIIISIVNSMIEPPYIINGEYKTSKKNEKENHGIGIENVINSVKKYGGSYLINPSEGKFHFTILIPRG